MRNLDFTHPIPGTDAAIVMRFTTGRLAVAVKGTDQAVRIGFVDAPRGRLALNLNGIARSAHRFMLACLAESLEDVSFRKDSNGVVLRHEDSRPMTTAHAPLALPLARLARAELRG